MKTIIISLLLLGTFATRAYCQDPFSGFLNGYMRAKAAKNGIYYSENSQQESSKRTDFKCLNDCTRNGYMYAYCQSQCSY